MQTATTILEQLGGNRFLAMTGAKDVFGSDDGIQFKLPRGAKDGINSVRVTLDPTDTYTVTFYKMTRGRSFKCTEISETSFVHADQLRALFTSATGLYTTL